MVKIETERVCDNINNEQTDGKYLSVCNSSFCGVVLYLSIESAGADG